MTTRTPGPWWFDNQFGEIKSERGVICRPGFSGSRVPTTENRANAFLISAAPDLLAALTIAESFMAGFEDDEAQKNMAEHLTVIRAAITKAKGMAA